MRTMNNIKFLQSKLKFFSDIYNGNSIPDDKKDSFVNKKIPYIATKNIDVDTHQIDYENGLSVNEDDGFRIAKTKSSLLCIEGGSAGKKLGYLNQEVAFVNKLCCFTPENIDPKFLFYSLQSSDFLSEFSLHLTGMIGGVKIGEIKNLYISHPDDLGEQHKIACFLDKKTGQIDNLISNQEKQIEKLKEYRQAIITKAVTKGLDPNVPMKDSGIEWIGEIPENWSTVRIKNVSWLKGRIGWDGLKSSEFIDSGPYLITGTDFSNGSINWKTCAHISEERYLQDELLHIKENDLLITKDGTIGKLAIVKNCPEKVSLNSGVMIIRNDTAFKYSNRYLYYVLQSNQFFLWYELSQSGNSTIKHLYQAQFYNFEFSYPSLNEQSNIANYLDERCSKIDFLLDSFEQKISKLKAYKQSLIYEYVTGKKRVSL